MSDTLKGFLYTWKIENFSMLPHDSGEALESETFVIDHWKDTEWHLRLFPRVNDTVMDECYIWFFLDVLKPEDVKGRVTVLLMIVSTERSSNKYFLLENILMKEEFWFGYLSLNDIYENKRIYLPNDTLTLRCYLIPVDEFSESKIGCSKDELLDEIEVLRRYSCRSGIQVNQRSVTLPVRNIDKHSVRIENISFIVENASTKLPDLKITLKFIDLINNEFVGIEIRPASFTVKKERIFVKCKMTVIGAHEQNQDSQESSHFFRLPSDDIWHFPPFLRKANLRPDLYLDDTLFLQCEFAFSSMSGMYNLETNHAPPTFEETTDRRANELVTHIEDLYSSGKFCDVDLRVGDQSFPAHKVVLCAMSPVFRAMFENDMKERDSGLVEIEDLDPETLRRMLRFMHSGVLKEGLSLENAGKLFSAADKYDIVTLKRRCSLLLTSSLSVASVCEVLVLASAHSDNFLITSVRDFISSHAKETFSSEQWKNFMGLNPKLSGEIMHQILMMKAQ